MCIHSRLKRTSCKHNHITLNLARNRKQILRALFPSPTLREMVFCFLSNWKEYDRTDKFISIINQTELRLVHNQMTIVSAIILLWIWKETEILLHTWLMALPRSSEINCGFVRSWKWVRSSAVIKLCFHFFNMIVLWCTGGFRGPSIGFHDAERRQSLRLIAGVLSVLLFSQRLRGIERKLQPPFITSAFPFFSTCKVSDNILS